MFYIIWTPISWPWYRAWPSPIMSGFHGAFATGVACQQGMLTLPDTWFQLLRPDSSNLPCHYSTFHLEYPLVLSRFCLYYLNNVLNKVLMSWEFLELSCSYPCLHGSSPSFVNKLRLYTSGSEPTLRIWSILLIKPLNRLMVYKSR